MGKRLAEGVAVWLATFVSNGVLGITLGTPVTAATFFIAAVVPLALLVIYWLFVEPRHKRTRVRAARFRKALEGTLDRDYKLDPNHKISQYGLLFEGASDPYRTSRYQELHIADLFEPDPRKGQKLLAGKAAEGAELLARAESDGFTPGLEGDLLTWERACGEDVAFYQRGLLSKGHAVAFTKHSFSQEVDVAHRVKRIAQEVAELRMYAADQAKLSRELAEREAGG